MRIFLFISSPTQFFQEFLLLLLTWCRSFSGFRSRDQKAVRLADVESRKRKSRHRRQRCRSIFGGRRPDLKQPRASRPGRLGRESAGSDGRRVSRRRRRFHRSPVATRQERARSVGNLLTYFSPILVFSLCRFSRTCSLSHLMTVMLRSEHKF